MECESSPQRPLRGLWVAVHDPYLERLIFWAKGVVGVAGG
jgi:hypothetical protein